MKVSLRELKAHLSEYIRQVTAGETVIINHHNRPVAQIVSIKRQSTLDDLAAQPGISWNGGKASGLQRGEVLPVGVSLADWVTQDWR